MVKVALIVLGSLGVLATALPLLRAEVWWIRIFDFPRLQAVVLLAGSLLLYLLFGWESGTFENSILAAIVASLVYQAYMMFPYTPLASKQVAWSKGGDPDAAMTLFFANVLDKNRVSHRLLEIIEKNDPDIVLAVEIDAWWNEQLRVLGERYEYSVLQPQENGYGMVLYSRLELIDPEVKFVIEDGVPSIHGEVRLRSGDTVVIRCLHPRPPFPTEDTSSLGRDAELLVVGKEIKQIDKPIIVFGDLNDVSWSNTNYLFQNISGMLDPRVGRGFYHTFHANYPFMRFPLDHFFHSKHFRLIELKRLAYFGSDHFPVLIQLSLEPDAEVEQEELQPDAKEEREAARKISKAT